jgi:hypothetical protein
MVNQVIETRRGPNTKKRITPSEIAQFIKLWFQADAQEMRAKGTSVAKLTQILTTQTGIEMREDTAFKVVKSYTKTEDGRIVKQANGFQITII